MLISIIIPAYNAEKYIEECLDSIINQQYKNLEVIIINDGSTDSTSSICKKYCGKNENIKLVEIENHGVSYARNIGIQEARGDYLMFVDSDDRLDLSFSKIMEKVKLNKKIVYINKFIPLNSAKEFLIKCILGINSKEQALSGPFSKLIKTSFLKESKVVFNSKIINGEDMLFNLELLLNSDNYEIINETFYLYRCNPYSVTNNFKDKILTNDILFHSELKELLEDTEYSSFINTKKIDGLFSMLRYISYIENYKEAKEKYKKIYIKEYLNVQISIKEYGLKKWILFKLFYLKCFFVIYYLFRKKYKKKKITDNNEYFISI